MAGFGKEELRACSSLASGRRRFGERGGGLGEGGKQIYDVVLEFIQLPHARTHAHEHYISLATQPCKHPMTRCAQPIRGRDVEEGGTSEPMSQLRGVERRKERPKESE